MAQWRGAFWETDGRAEGRPQGLRAVAVARPGQVSWLVSWAGMRTRAVWKVFSQGQVAAVQGRALRWALWAPNEGVKWAGGLTWAPGQAAAPGAALNVGPTGLLASAWDRARRPV